MSYSDELIAEMEVLMLFDLATTQEGIKIHKSAEPEIIDAAKRLHEKGFTTQVDGGYLTSLGTEAAEHTQNLYTLLTAG
jgi:uncharacterized protein (TIGR02647 family)